MTLKKPQLEKDFRKWPIQTEKICESNERSAHYLAKKGCPVKDYPGFLNLQTRNANERPGSQRCIQNPVKYLR